MKQKRTTACRVWLCMALMLATALGVNAQGKITLKLTDEPLPKALRLIEQQGGKSIIFSVSETEKYKVSADIRDTTQAGAINHVLWGKPFVAKERPEYFVVQKQESKTTAVGVSGVVVDEKGEPMPYCNVLLLDADSTFIDGCVTKEDGSFMMMGKNDATYLLKASYIGYTTTVQKAEMQQQNRIQLSSELQALAEVTISANRPLIEPNSRGLKVNVAGTSFAKMGTASELLGHLPFVAGRDGEYTVLGHGTPEIYINNRKVRDKSELNRLRAEDILSTEVILVPGAEYASNVAAVIRIHTIKQQGDGWSGSLYANYSQGVMGRGYEQVSLNYRVGGLDVFGSGNITQSSLYGSYINDDILYASSVWNICSTSNSNQRQDYFYGTLGANYDFNEHHSVGVRYTPNTPFGNHKRYVYSDVMVERDGEFVERLYIEQINENKTRWKHTINGYYVGDIGKWHVDVNTDYYFGKSESTQQVLNNEQMAAESQSLVNDYLYAVKATASTALPVGHMTVGTEEVFTDRRDQFFQSGFSADADNHVKQSIYSAFASYSMSIKKWNLSAGLRYERQQTNYYENSVYKSEQSPTYNDLIPSLSANYATGDWNIIFTYKGVRENHSYSMLTNAISYKSKYEYITGNPLLERLKSNGISFYSTWKWVNLNAWYYYIRDMFTPVMQAYNDITHPGVVIIDYRNIPSGHSYGVVASLTPKFGIWQAKVDINYSFFDADLKSIGFEHQWNDPYLYFILDNTFTFPCDWLVNVEATHVPAYRQRCDKRKAYSVVDLRVSKSFLKHYCPIKIWVYSLKLLKYS